MTKEKIELLKKLGYNFYIKTDKGFRYFLLYDDAKYFVGNFDIKIHKIK